MGGWVYMLASKRYGTLHVGVTSDLARRVWEHRNHLIPGFTSRYGVTNLVWCEAHDRIEHAIQREKAVKHWPRRWKTALVDEVNPEWDDLNPMLM